MRSSSLLMLYFVNNWKQCRPAIYVFRLHILAAFILEDALCVWTNLGKHSLFVWLFVSSVKTGTRRIIRLDELSSVVGLERRTTEDSSSGRIMRLVPVFKLETNNQTNNECLPKFVQTYNASSSIKTAILRVVVQPKRHANHKPIKHTLLRVYIDRKKAGNWEPTCIAAAYRRLPS